MFRLSRTLHTCNTIPRCSRVSSNGLDSALQRTDTEKIFRAGFRCQKTNRWPGTLTGRGLGNRNPVAQLSGFAIGSCSISASVFSRWSTMGEKVRLYGSHFDPASYLSKPSQHHPDRTGARATAQCGPLPNRKRKINQTFKSTQSKVCDCVFLFAFATALSLSLSLFQSVSL